MVSITGIMIGLYILTRMADYILDRKVSGLTRILAILTAFVTLAGVAWLAFDPNMNRL